MVMLLNQSNKNRLRTEKKTIEYPLLVNTPYLLLSDLQRPTKVHSVLAPAAVDDWLFVRDTWQGWGELLHQDMTTAAYKRLFVNMPISMNDRLAFSWGCWEANSDYVFGQTEKKIIHCVLFEPFILSPKDALFLNFVKIGGGITELTSEFSFTEITIHMFLEDLL